MGNCYPGNETSNDSNSSDEDDISVDETGDKPTPSLRMNMMRERTNRDPFHYFEVIEVIGAGSMGSVSKVRKRKCRVGGSARKKPNSNPFFPVLFFFKLRKAVENQKSHRRDISDLTTQSNFSWFQKKGDILQVPSSRSLSIRSSNRSICSNTSEGSSRSKFEMVYAIKSIHLNRITDENFVRELRNEIDILKRLDHPNIVRPIETFEHRRQLYIVMELCSGGDLYRRDPYTEADAAKIVGKVLSAIAYMHRFNIIHRDLKYENILFESNSPKAEIKIIDFGLSKKYLPEDHTLKDGVGTIYTMAPQVLKGNYDSQADLWSVGVVAFMLLSSQMPFYGKKRRHVVEKIMKCQYHFNGRGWMNVSDDAKDFVSSLLQYDPKKRPTALEATRHPFLNEKTRSGGRKSQGPQDLHECIERFSTYSKLKKLGLMVVAHKSTPEELGDLRKAFSKFDTKKDGTINFEEFRVALSSSGYSKSYIERMFRAVDLDNTGEINYTEFLAATIEALGVIEEERLAEAFDRLDSDDSGWISLQNLRELFAGELSDEKIKSIIEEVDLNNDNKITYDEFLLLWEQRNDDGPIDVVPRRERKSSNLSQRMRVRMSLTNEELIGSGSSTGEEEF